MSPSPHKRRRRVPRRLALAFTAGAAALAALFMAANPAAADPSASPSAPAAPSGSSSSGSIDCSSPDAKTFIIGNTQDLDSQNPYSGLLTISYELYGDVYDLLEGWSQKDFTPIPGLASSWTTSPDGLTWTFTIRSGVTWSDGVPLTAADVAYTFNRAINDETANAAYYNYVKNIKSVEAPDATTAIFHMAAPDAIMDQLWVPILPEHIWKNVPESQSGTFANTAMVGSGAFQFVSWSPGQSIVLKANKNYWGGTPKIDCLIYQLFDNETTEIQALEKGEIDAVDGISGLDYQSLANQNGITRVDSKFGTGFDELAFNTGAATVDNKPVGNGAPAARDKAFRQAVAYAIDPQQLVDKVLLGYGTAGKAVIPPAYSEFAYDPGSAAYTYDPSKAEDMLDAAGYTKDSAGWRIDKATGKEMNLRLYEVDDSPEDKSTLTYISQWLTAVGIKNTPQQYDDDKLTDIIANGQYDLFVWGWGVEPDPSFQLSTMTCDQRDTGSPSSPTAGWSDSFYCNPTYDQLYQQQSEQLGDQRAATVKQMQQILYQDAPYIVLYYDDDLEAYNSAKWTGVAPQPNPGGQLFFQYGFYTYFNLDLVADVKAAASASAGGSAVAAADTSKGSSTPIWVWIVIAVAVVLVVAGGVGVGLRRRATADERE